MKSINATARTLDRRASDNLWASLSLVAFLISLPNHASCSEVWLGCSGTTSFHHDVDAAGAPKVTPENDVIVFNASEGKLSFYVNGFLRPVQNLKVEAQLLTWENPPADYMGVGIRSTKAQLDRRTLHYSVDDELHGNVGYVSSSWFVESECKLIEPKPISKPAKPVI